MSRVCPYTPDQMDNEGVDALAAAIIKQAAIDYWHDCAVGKYKKGSMSKEEYEKYVARHETERRARKAEEQRFFKGEWYRHLCHDRSVTGEKMIKQLEYLRVRNLHLRFSADAEEGAA